MQKIQTTKASELEFLKISLSREKNESKCVELRAKIEILEEEILAAHNESIKGG